MQHTPKTSTAKNKKQNVPAKEESGEHVHKYRDPRWKGRDIRIIKSETPGTAEAPSNVGHKWKA